MFKDPLLLSYRTILLMVALIPINLMPLALFNYSTQKTHSVRTLI